MVEPIRYALEEPAFKSRLRQIISEYCIDTVVETGIDTGSSALEFCQLVDSYIGVDIDENCISSVRKRLGDSGLLNWKLLQGNSPDVLKSLSLNERTLLFLDAHCYLDTECPILDEIRSIPCGRGVLVFHDIAVPGREYGAFYPVINGQEQQFSYSTIKEELSNWSATHRIEYLNEYSHELNPGVMFAYPK